MTDAWWDNRPLGHELGHEPVPGDRVEVALGPDDGPVREYEYLPGLRTRSDDTTGFFRHDELKPWRGEYPWRRADQVNLPPECRTALNPRPSGVDVEYFELVQCRHSDAPERWVPLDALKCHTVELMRRAGDQLPQRLADIRENPLARPCPECPYYQGR